jgi:hypothetical protein
MDEFEYAHILLVSGGDWLNWHDVPYSASTFERWKHQGLVEQDKGENRDTRYTHWRLTDLAHKTKGETK